MKSLAVESSFNSRQVALRICLQVVQHGQSLSRQLETQIISLTDAREKAFCSELCYGLCRYYYVLAQQLNELLKKPFKSRDRDIQVILLLGLYQIRFMRVEDHAAVNESVKLLRFSHKNWAKGLVNAVLRSYLRQLSQQPQNGVAQLTQQEQLLAYPQWIRTRIEKDWGQQAYGLLQAGNQRAPMVLRVDVDAIARDDYLVQLAGHSISAAAHPLIAQAIVLEKALDVDQLPGFDKALVSVQDSAAQIAATLMQCQPGMRVLDACAAPGGKTLHILQSCKNIDMIALDKDEQRLQRVAQNLQRAGLTAEVACGDANKPETWFDGNQFDRILLDAPCSASGIIRRHPDIRLLRQSEDIQSLVVLQHQLLDSMWRLLKPGGLMVYSTCSIFKAENEDQIARFLHAHLDCVEHPLNTVQWGIQRSAGRQILTGLNDMDGFYYACLEKAQT